MQANVRMSVWTICDLHCLQDYETCLSALRMLASDLKSDREWRYYAAAQVASVSLSSRASLTEQCWQ